MKHTNRQGEDTPRDVRGFAVKFYTKTGNWDLVGNNIPVFFMLATLKRRKVGVLFAEGSNGGTLIGLSNRLRKPAVPPFSWRPSSMGRSWRTARN